MEYHYFLAPDQGRIGRHLRVRETLLQKEPLHLTERLYARQLSPRREQACIAHVAMTFPSQPWIPAKYNGSSDSKLPGRQEERQGKSNGNSRT
jgi:hypothetical protein